MKLLFLDSSTPSSRREHEIQDAAARSHAATIAHERAKRQGKLLLSSRARSSAVHHTRAKSFGPFPPSVFGNESDTLLEQHELADDDGAAAATIGHDPQDDSGHSIVGLMTLIQPQSILIRGQSDPFNAMPVQIDPKTHELIIYSRSAFLFRRHRVDLKTWTSSPGAVADWQDTRRSLEDQGLGNAFLAQLSASLAAEDSSKQLAESALVYVRRSTNTLRKRLESREEDWDCPRVWRHVALLQNAEMLIRNREATVIHGQMMRRIFDHWVARGNVIPMKLLIHSLYVDVQSSVIFLSRPNFKPSTKLLQQFPDFSSDLLRDVSAVSRDSMRRLDNQLLGKALREIILRWEQCRVITFFYGRRLWTFTSQILAVDHFLDMEESFSRQLDSPGATFCHAQAYMSLAALYLIRLTTMPEQFEGKLLFDAHKALLRRLRYHLEVSKFLEDERLYSRARLWALFVGAHSEQQAALMKISAPIYLPRDWFNIQLKQHAEQSGLRNWNSVREVLEGFMYSEVVPDPSQWYGTTPVFSKSFG